MALSGINPRRFPRYATDVFCRFRETGSFQWQQGQIVNMSKTGFCLKASQPPAKDIEIEVEMDLLVDGKWENRKLDAVVMWKRGKRSGLRFIKKSASS